MKQLFENWNKFLNEQHFDTATGAPLTDKGREMCAKNPECKAKHMKDAAPAQQQPAPGQEMAQSAAAHKEKMAQQQQGHDKELSAQDKKNAVALKQQAQQLANLKGKDFSNMSPAEIILSKFGGSVEKMPDHIRKGYEAIVKHEKIASGDDASRVKPGQDKSDRAAATDFLIDKLNKGFTASMERRDQEAVKRFSNMRQQVLKWMKAKEWEKVYDFAKQWGYGQ